MRNFITPKGLSEKYINDIAQLEKTCENFEELRMKMNWDMLKNRSPLQNNDFLCYEDDKLIGFLGLYDIQEQCQEIEITGMVHPDYRRQGIFKELFENAKQKCADLKAERILLVSERSISAAAAFVKSTGAKYYNSEFSMLFNDGSVPKYPQAGINLRNPLNKDDRNLSRLDKLCFGYGLAGDEDGTVHTDGDDAVSNSYSTTLIAELDDTFIGKIGLMKENGKGYIFGFAVEQELRGKGYGREILSLALSKLLSEGIEEVLLEVAVKNDRALLLYKSCGFKEITVYDYHILERISGF